MKVWPLKFRDVGQRLLFADDAGTYFASDHGFLDRYATDALSATDEAFLRRSGHAFEAEGDLQHTAFAYRWSKRQNNRDNLSYVMLIPTLRCRLACTYCQVSRASKDAQGYDWTPAILGEVLAFLDRLKTTRIKIEFQGGEPTLRLDLLHRVRDFCRERFEESEFVVCTNLQDLDDDILAFLSAPDTHVSTSLDGPAELHDRRRTQDAGRVSTFFQNLQRVAETVAPGHLSALPTVDPDDPPDFETLVALYESFGLSSVYLRPINYQGFARRALGPDGRLSKWNALHRAFIAFLIERNARTGGRVEDFYFSHILRRVLQAGHDGHVDLRNPTLLASDYIVVNYDGVLYPSDEARMLARIGQIDLAIGSVKDGIDRSVVAQLNGASINNFDPDCIHCPYQAFCGTDTIDNLSRYARIDVPRGDTWFCGRHLALFDLAFELIYSADEKVQASLAKWLRLPAWSPRLAPVHQ